jgi:16S rRNA (cytosine967-C5)-methyltransferase
VTPVRLAAARVLLAVERGGSTLAAEIDRAREGVSDPRDRGLLVELAAGTLRWRNEIDALLRAASGRAIDAIDPRARAVLRTAIYQLRHLDRVPAHAVVHESVETVRAIGVPRAGGFVNAVLRSLQRGAGPDVLPIRPAEPSRREEALAYLSITLSHPAWLVERWLDRYGFEATERWCQFNNAPPELTIRSAGRLGPDELIARLLEAGVPAAPARYVADAWQLPPGALGRLPPALRAEIAIQDEGSQLVARVVSVEPGQRVLDVCAAPGGKTLLLSAELAGTGLLVASEWRASRIRLLRATVAQAPWPVHLLQLDARRPLPFSSVFDRVLLDVPCSGLGVLRRDPDLKWMRQPGDLAPFGLAALGMLGQAADTVRPGGQLVYATCSSEPEENALVVDAFLRARPGWTSLPAPVPAHLHDAQGHLASRPSADAMDAYFAAVLVRSTSP